MRVFVVVFVWLFGVVLAHPTGHLLFEGGVLFWSFVCPVNDARHHACVMVWDEAGGVRPWLVSEYPASDWMLAPGGDGALFLFETYFDAARDVNRSRLLKADYLQEPVVVWDWFDDAFHVGQSGFVVLADGSVLFAAYPHVYVLREHEVPVRWSGWLLDEAVFSVASAGEAGLLVSAERDIWLVSSGGEVAQHWPDLLEDALVDVPFMGNRIFDAAFHDDVLWLAYWGQRRFDVLKDGQRDTVLSVAPPFLPHAVAAGDGVVFFLASSVEAAGRLEPQLWKLESGVLVRIWGVD